MRLTEIRFVLLAFATLPWMPASALAQQVPKPKEYRTENYRAPTPATLEGARVLTTTDAHRVWTGREAIFLDVLPRPPRPANLPAGTIWRDKPRQSIPGSIWLPDTGYGALAPSMETYLRSNLARISAGDRAKLFVVFCQRACWMSWNAAKRILTMGYVNVAWYPDGTDGWQEANLPLQELTPEPLPEQ
jgi:PQQ-dependent catabolism-associated CXXCW motif protein